MSKVARPATILTIALLTAGAASAQSGHHGGDASTPRMKADAGPMGDDRDRMRRMMMKMHRPGMTGMDMGMGMGMGHMMDRDVMRTMMGPDMMMNGMSQEMPDQMMQSRIDEYDSDGDGALSLDEFEAWHSATMRERMVDRFQHLDADGDGTITTEEANALAGRMTRMRDHMNRMRETDTGAGDMMQNTPDEN